MGLQRLWCEIGKTYYGWLVKHAHPLCPLIPEWRIKEAVFQHRIKYGNSI